MLDENIGKTVANRLREDNYDIKSAIEDMRGASDALILSTARKERRIIVTLDRDFGILAFRDSKKHLGILFLRLQQESSNTIYMVLSNVLSEHGNKLWGKFITASEYKVRIR